MMPRQPPHSTLHARLAAQPLTTPEVPCIRRYTTPPNFSATSCTTTTNAVRRSRRHPRSTGFRTNWLKSFRS